MKKITLIALAGALVLGAGLAVAQVVTPPTAVNVSGSADLVPIVPNGAATPQQTFAKAGQIGSVLQYKWGGTITTDPAYTFANGVTVWSGHKASGLSTATITTEPNPTDGKRECYVLDQTTTTLTWTANTGQTVDSSVRASGVASTPTCIFYSAATATWYQGP